MAAYAVALSDVLISLNATVNAVCANEVGHGVYCVLIPLVPILAVGY
jgi:hypothetical protein